MDGDDNSGQRPDDKTLEELARETVQQHARDALALAALDRLCADLDDAKVRFDTDRRTGIEHFLAANLKWLLSGFGVVGPRAPTGATGVENGSARLDRCRPCPRPW